MKSPHATTISTYALILLNLFCISSLSRASDALEFNGAFYYTELNTPTYLAALYLEEKSADIDTILSQKNSKLMRIIVTRDSWRPKSWKRYWSNSIAISNTGTANDPNTYKSLGTFASLAKDTLVKGDLITVSYDGRNTQVMLNGTEVVKNNSVELFNYLANVWIGEVPPSTAFKEAILGLGKLDEQNTLSTVLSSHTYPPARRDIYAKWDNLSKQKEIEEQQRLAEQERIKKEAIAREIAEAAALQKQLAALENANAATKPQAPKQAAASQSVAKKPEKETDAKIKQEKLKEELQAELKRKQRDLEERFLSDITNWQIQRYVNKHTEYPLWAERFGEEGIVNLDFTVSKGGQIGFVNEEEQESSLVREVKKHIIESMQHIADMSPHDSDNDTANKIFNIKYVFSLDKADQPEPEKPIIPQHLLTQDTDEQIRDRLVQFYLTYVLDVIESNITYPEAAKVLRQRARLIVNFSINRWGEIDSATVENPSRHDALNNAMIDAVENSAPFKPFPIPIFGVELISGKIEHAFR